jgi:hypothetical protein
VNKKILLSVVTTLIVLPTLVSAQTLEIPSVTFSDEPPFSFNLSVYISDVSDITGVSFNLTFDPWVVNVKDVRVNESAFSNLSIWAIHIDNESGYVSVALVSNDGMTTTVSEPFLDIEFIALDYGSSNLDFISAELSLFDFNTMIDKAI